MIQEMEMPAFQQQINTSAEEMSHFILNTGRDKSKIQQRHKHYNRKGRWFSLHGEIKFLGPILFYFFIYLLQIIFNVHMLIFYIDIIKQCSISTSAVLKLLSKYSEDNGTKPNFRKKMPDQNNSKK